MRIDYVASENFVKWFDMVTGEIYTVVTRFFPVPPPVALHMAEKKSSVTALAHRAIA